MEAVTPFWFKQRQCKIEPAGPDNLLKVTGPNLGEAFLRIEEVPGGPDGGKAWKAALRLTPTGEDVDSTPAEFPNPTMAWDAAFEVYRRRFII
jgi:hypothetical protein